MDLGLRDRVAVVAASSRGIGRATAEVFAREGARVVVNGRDADVLHETAEAVRALGAEVEEVAGDVATPEGCTSLIDRALARFGRIDALVTNAGGPPSKPFDEVTDEEWEAAFQLTLMSAVRLLRAALPALRESHGSVVSVTSISAKQPVRGLILSNALRPAVTGLDKGLTADLAASGVRINCVGPGLIWTDRQRYLVEVRAREAGITVDEAKQRGTGGVPMGRYGTAEEAANLIVFLCSPAAGYITGSTVLVDGGLYTGLV